MPKTYYVVNSNPKREVCREVYLRQQIEKRIAKRFIIDAVAAGYLINIDNGGDDFELPEPTNKVSLILKTMFATDDEKLYLFLPGSDQYHGWVWFIYGNDGWDVISDYSMNLEPLMEGANKIADSY